MTLMLGTPVACTARAWVARRRRFPYKPEPTWQPWHIPVRGNYGVPRIVQRGEDVVLSPGGQLLEHAFKPSDRTNKSVVRAEVAGSGIIIGLERKMIGQSVGGGGEDDLGYFVHNHHVDLYVVKSDLRSTPFYVPLEDAHPLAIDPVRPARSSLALGGAGHAA